MGPSEDDRERLIRLRERQLRARDPQKKDRQMQRMLADRQRKSVTKFTFGTMLEDIPLRWLGAILGGSAGVLVGVVLPALFDAAWAKYVWLPAILIMMSFGFIMGRAFDTRNELRDHLR